MPEEGQRAHVEIFFQQVVNGLQIASVIALIAMGITMIFGLTGLVMFAHGELLMLGGYVTWRTVELNVFGGDAANFFFGVALAVVVVGVLGYLMERGLFRFTFASPINGFIISLGLIVFLQHAIQIMPLPGLGLGLGGDQNWGATTIAVPKPIAAVWTVSEVRIPATRVLIVIATIVVVAFAVAAIYRTGLGRALRASASDRDTAGLMGIPVRRYITAVFVIGSGVAGLGGALLIGQFAIDPFIGGRFVIKGFAVALVGGLGNPVGAVLAAIILGLGEAMGAGYFKTEWTESYAFILMIVVLLIRPQGLLTGLQGPPTR